MIWSQMYFLWHWISFWKMCLISHSHNPLWVMLCLAARTNSKLLDQRRKGNRGRKSDFFSLLFYLLNVVFSVMMMSSLFFPLMYVFKHIGLKSCNHHCPHTSTVLHLPRQWCYQRCSVINIRSPTQGSSLKWSIHFPSPKRAESHLPRRKLGTTFPPPHLEVL